MDYAETLRYLYSQLPMYQRIGPAAYKTDLGNTRALLELQGKPERSFHSIHIAGTNGKGSVAHFLASILQTQGYKTGLYTSPHLKDFRERIRINGIMIPENDVVDYVRRYKDAFNNIKPSFFEMTVGMAFEHFALERVDIAVIETGLGGRLDSTNVIHPELSIITNIGFDHMRFLGNDLSSIASEKAGIIKAGTPVICGSTVAEALKVIRTTADEKKAAFHYAPDEIIISPRDTGAKNTGILSLNAEIIPRNENLELECPLPGHYQIENMATMLCACTHLPQNLMVNQGSIISGVRNVKANTGIRGRWDILSEQPYTVADTAHNLEGLRASLGQWMQMDYRERHVVLGMVEDKDISGLLKLFPKDAKYYFCRPDIARGMAAEELYQRASEIGLKGKAYKGVRAAYMAAKKSAEAADSIYVGGSTFVVAEVI